MKTRPTIVTCLVLLLGLLGGCNGYEDGPAISFRSKLSRLTSRNKVVLYEVNGVDSTFAVNDALDTTSYNDHGYMWYASRDGGGDIYAGIDFGVGSWEWRNHKQDLFLVFSGYPFETGLWEILRLSEEELWLRLQSNGNTYLLKMEAFQQ